LSVKATHKACDNVGPGRTNSAGSHATDTPLTSSGAFPVLGTSPEEVVAHAPSRS